MQSREESASGRQEPRRFSRSSIESIATLRSRFSGRSKKSDMSPTERDHAYLSDAVYADPEHRESEVRGYAHVRGEIPPTGGSGHAVPLNGKRWAVYRAPDENRYVLAFRGTKGWSDVGHDLRLLSTPFGKHKYMTEAAAWSLQVMLFIAKVHDKNTTLKFSLTGHSLGGTVAMGVLFLLHDVPKTAQYLEAGRAEDQNAGGLPDHETYVKDFLDPFVAAKEGRAWDTPPYEIIGGDIFNPGAWPRFAPGVLGPTALAGLATGGVGAVAVFIAASVHHEARHASERRHDRGVESYDKMITTHHILGDVCSNGFGLGKEKTYGTKKVLKHPIENFLCKNEIVIA